MQHVDCLSRNFEDEIQVNNIVNITEIEWVQAVQLKDEDISKIVAILKSKKNTENKNYFDNYALKNGILYRKVNGELRWAVPNNCRWLICRLNHDDTGHFGAEKTMERIKKNYWFKGMSKFIKKYVSSCMNCLYMKHLSGPKPGMLHPIPKGKVPFETIHIDHVGPFIRSKQKNTHILVLVDGFTKFTIVEPVKNTKVKYVIKILENFIYLFGVPNRLITDRGSAFTSKTMKTFCESFGIKHIMNAVATPRANGQCERINETVLESLRCLSVNDDSEEMWDTHLKKVQFGINSNVNKSTGETPLKVLIGIDSASWSESKLLHAIKENPKQTNLSELRNKVSDKISHAQSKAKESFDKKRKKQVPFKTNDLVMVRKTSFTNTGTSKKLLPVFKGPFRVTTVLPNDRYVVEDLRGTRKSKTMIAVDNLKPWMVLHD